MSVAGFDRPFPFRTGDTFTMPVARRWWQFWKPPVEERRFVVTSIVTGRPGEIITYEPR